MAAADVGSGLVHWGADTWGRDDLPVIGPRLLVPFRVHHINPDDFLRRRFIDTNGDVAVLAVPVLLGFLSVPLARAWGGPAAVAGFTFCGVGMLTNQIHQWAHMPAPPRLIRALQACGLVLGRAAHAAHHERPMIRITTGWATAVRGDRVLPPVRGGDHAPDRRAAASRDRRYERRYGVPAPPADARHG